MKVSKVPGVAFYCTQRTEDGSYCKRSVRAPKPTSIDQPSASVGSYALMGSGSTNRDALAAAALNYAASLLRGAGPEMADEGIAVAIKAYQAMKAVA